MRRTNWSATLLTLGLLLPCLAAALPARADGPAAVPLAAPIAQYTRIWWESGHAAVLPAVAYNPTHDEYLVVWENQSGGVGDIYARRVGGDGSLRSWAVIAPGDGKRNMQPVVAYSPLQDAYLIVYTNLFSPSDYDLWACAVSWDLGSVAAPFTTPPWYAPGLQRMPAIAYNSQADEFLVVYANTSTGGLQDIAAQRIKAGDLSLPGWRTIATGAGEMRTHPGVAYNRTRNEFLIAYTYAPAPGADDDIYARTSSATMGTLSAEFAICDNTYQQWDPVLAAGADEYMAVWSDNGLIDVNPMARRLSGSGAPLGGYCGFPVAYVAEEQGVPALAYAGGAGYLAAWRQGYFAAEGDIYGRYLVRGQDVGPGYRFPIDTYPYTQDAPAVACDRGGRCLVVEEDEVTTGGDVAVGAWLLTPRRAYLPTVSR